MNFAFGIYDSILNNANRFFGLINCHHSFSVGEMKNRVCHFHYPVDIDIEVEADEDSSVCKKSKKIPYFV